MFKNFSESDSRRPFLSQAQGQAWRDNRFAAKLLLRFVNVTLVL